MLRIVVLSTYFAPVIGGVESNAERLARYLVARGDRVQVLTKRVGGAQPDVEEMSGVAVRRVGPAGERSAAGKWQLVPAAFAWLVGHRASHDVVCAVDYRGIGIAAIAARAVTGRPVVVQAQTAGVLTASHAAVPAAQSGLAEETLAARLLKWPPRAVYRRADAFACISHGLEREALAAGISADRVHFLPNAIDMDRFAPSEPARRARRAALGLAPDAVVCLFLGRLSREKGLLDLIEAWRLLPRSAAVLLIVGPEMADHPWNAGPPARALVARYGLEDSVRFLGSATDTPNLLRAADVLVQPSHFEAQGLSAVEALACGVPVVASKVGGLIDFVADGVNGRLVPPVDSPALAAALTEVVQDGAMRARLAAAARSSVREYDERVAFERMRQLFDRVVAARRPRG
jgi:glycosyltransferase involved in cell wall biosynthesis